SLAGALAGPALALAAGAAWAEQQPIAAPPNTPTQSASAAIPAAPTTPPAPAALTRAQLWAACVNVSAAQQAIASCSQIVQSNRESDVNIGIAYFNRGNANMSLHNAQGAADDYTQALSHNFQQPDVYYGRG